MTQADDMRKIAEDAIQKQEQAARLELKKKAEADKKAKADGYQQGEREYPEIRQDIADAAHRGLTAFSVPIFHWNSTPKFTPEQWGRFEAIKNLATADGFRCDISSYCMEPVGSDPISFSNLYDADIVISWER